MTSDTFQHLSEEKVDELFKKFKAEGMTDEEAFGEIYSIDCNMDDEAKDEYAEGFYSYQGEEDIDCKSDEALAEYVQENFSQNPTVKYWFDKKTNKGHITYENNPYIDMSSEKENTINKEIKLKDLLDVWWNSVRIVINGKVAILYKECRTGDYELDLDNNPYGEKILDAMVHTKSYWDEDGDGYPIIYATIINDMELIPEKSNLTEILNEFDENGKYAEKGSWKIARGGYDLAFQLYYDGVAVVDGISSYGINNLEIDRLTYGDDDEYDVKTLAQFIATIYKNYKLES